MAANFGGYDYNFVDKILDRFTCETICTKVLKNPHLTGCCGQHFCESCLNNWFTKNRKKCCPHCRAEGKEFQHLLNKNLMREIDSLRIHCTYKEEGCQWIGELGSLKDHLESANGCGYVEVECPNKCRVPTTFLMGKIKKMKRKDLQNHLKKECYLRPYQCEHCGHNDTYQNITGQREPNAVSKLLRNSHYDQCPDFPLECPNKCGMKEIKRRNMVNHRSQCSEEEVQCPNKCHQKSKKPLATRMKRKFLERHLTEECELRPYQCEHCGLKGTYSTITTKHYTLCLEFPLECPNKCGRKDVKRKDMKDHRSQCPEEMVECPNKCCTNWWRLRTTTMKRKSIDKHLADECELRPYQCEHCGKRDTYSEITKSHYNICPETPLECPNKCGRKDIKRKDMKDHHNQCPEEPVQCPFEDAGCKEKLVRRELGQHLSATQQQHLLMIMGAYKEMKKENEVMKRENGKIKEAYDEVKKEIKKENASVKQKFSKMENELHQVKEELSQTKAELKKFKDTHGNAGATPTAQVEQLDPEPDEYDHQYEDDEEYEYDDYYHQQEDYYDDYEHQEEDYDDYDHQEDYYDED